MTSTLALAGGSPHSAKCLEPSAPSSLTTPCPTAARHRELLAALRAIRDPLLGGPTITTRVFCPSQSSSWKARRTTSAPAP